MKSYKILHIATLMALLVVAAMSFVGTFRMPPDPSPGTRTAPLVAVVIWSLLLWKIWKRPHAWGLGVGVFLFLMIGFQCYLWGLAWQKMATHPLTNMPIGAQDLVSFLLVYELPIFLAGTGCILLRIFGTEKNSLTNPNPLPPRPDTAPGSHFSQIPMHTTALGSLSTIIIYAGDAVRCARFFEEHFGLKPIGEFSPEWAELDAGACRLAFHQAYGENGPITSATGSPMNPHKIVFTVPDVVAARQHLIDAGVEVGEIHRFEDQGELIFCQGTDPEGHVFQLCNR